MKYNTCGMDYAELGEHFPSLRGGFCEPKDTETECVTKGAEHKLKFTYNNLRKVNFPLAHDFNHMNHMEWTELGSA